MTRQLTIDGQWETTDDHTAEARRIIEKYPQALKDPGLFLFNCLKERYGWPAYLPEDQKHELREFLRDATSLNRRRQELREEDDKRQRGL